jgi:hypothetical protein
VLRSFSSSSIGTEELQRRFLSAPQGSEVRVSRRAYATASLGVRFFRSIQGFNGDDYDSRALILRGTCMKTSLMSPTRSGQLQYGSGDIGSFWQWLFGGPETLM